MAAESSAKRMTFEDIALTLFGLLLVGQAIQRAPLLLQEHLGIDIGAPYLVATAALGNETPLGTRVSTVNGTSYYTRAGADEKAGTFPPGTSLTLREGPESIIGGGRWWRVEDDAGTSGWVPESALVREGAGGLGPETKIGSEVRALMAADVWDVPGGLSRVGQLVKGERGKIADGPKEANGSRWWFFDRDESDEDGWLAESALLLAGDTDWREGSRVRTVHDADLFERAGGGRAVGMLSEGESASILGGPVLVGGAYWWLVETQDGTQGWVAETALEDAGVRGWVKGVLGTILIVGTIIALFLLGGIVYATIRTNQVRAREARRIKEAIPKMMQPKRNERWDKVIEHVSSENPNDWRLAIIEADVMLDELITRMGYHGMTLGDKLKQITRGDVRSVDAAWEAHRVRNQVAHEGSDFVLTQREARRIIDLYGQVFEEFRYI